MTKHNLGIFILFFTLAISVHAHSIGKSFEQAQGDFLIDIGASSATLVTQKTLHFDFNIVSVTSTDPVSFSHVQVRIQEGSQTMVEATLTTEEGLPVLSYIFPKKGEYELYARFLNQEDTLAQVSFSFVVESEIKNDYRGIILVVGILVFGIIGYIVSTKRKSAGTLL
jgi:hypothetical protein